MKDLCIIFVSVLRFAECTKAGGGKKKNQKCSSVRTNIEAKARSGAKGTLPPRPDY